MINVRPKGRLGNLMFQYCLSRIISEVTGYATDMELPFKNCKMLKGKIINTPVEKLIGHEIDLKKVLDNKEQRRIYLNGFFHQVKYYADYKQQIKKWFYINENYRKPGTGDLVIHVRGGDLYNKGSNAQHVPCPYNYYRDIINSSDHNNIFIVTEDPKDIIVQKLHMEHKLEIISQSVLEDYYFMFHASKLVLSVCSIVWWAGWLGRAKEVHFPQAGFWHPQSIRKEVDLMVNENRYVYHDLGVQDNWQATDKQIEQLL